ncbi:MAG: hypothetical protein ACTHK3_03570 [Solirubrobacterales bacterium]
MSGSARPQNTYSMLLPWVPKILAIACVIIFALGPATAWAEEPPLEVESVCGEAEGTAVECFALEVEPEVQEAENALEGSGERGGYSPTDLISAYKLNTGLGEGKTIAIVDAFDDPNAEADLAVYRATYGLSPCTTANGCFKKVNQLGAQANYPAPNAGWGKEISLDLDMASAVCPRCHILLVEANDNYSNSLGTAENTAAALGATTISNSWGGNERAGEVEEDKAFHHPGIPITVSSGDSAYGARYPASSPEVIAVGGTALRKDAGTRGWAETAWAKAGSGCSAYETKPTWQKDTGCPRRFVADVSAVADPTTPVSVYDSYKATGWLLFGGTSASAPIIAGVEALSSQTTRERGAQAFYDGTAGPLFDPTEGINGYCTPPAEHAYFCHAQLGFDGPTGNGSPDGVPTAAPLVSSVVAEVGVGEAKLIGTVNPRGSEAKYRFEWGATKTYGNSVPVGEGSVAPGTGNVSVSNTISGLEGEHTYHFRLVATNASGTTYGEDHHLFTRGPGWAAEPTHVASYGGSGSEPGKFETPRTVAVSPVSGNVFATDEKADRIEVFTAEGKFVRQFGSEGIEPGKFKDPFGITVDKNGHVWISDWLNVRIQEFTEGGSFIRAFGLTGVSSGHPAGIAADGAGHLWVTDPAEDVAVEYSEEGSYIRQFSTGNFPLGVAIDEAGHIWTDNDSQKGPRLEEHSESGVFIKSFATNTPGQFRWGTAGQLAIDPNGNIWVTSFNSAIQLGGPHEFFAEVLVFSPSGNFEESFSSLGSEEDQLKDPYGLALDPRGYVWLTSTSQDKLSKWAIPPLGTLTAATEAASGVTLTGATLNGAVNPGGFNVSYLFEYGKTTGYGMAAPAGASTIYAGYNTSKVSQAITGLEPHTTYHYRTVAANFGKTVYGEDKTFTTPRTISMPTYSFSFGTRGSGNGQFIRPSGVAVDSSGNVWVVDTGNGRVEKFNSKGEFLCKFGSGGTGTGQFSWWEGAGIAADASGDVWVADSQNARLQKIGPSCEYLGQLGSRGSGNGQFSFPYGVAIDPWGNIWVSDAGNLRLEKFNAKGEYLAQCGGPGTGVGRFEGESPGIAADADGNVWVGDEVHGAQEFNSKCEYVTKFDKTSSGGTRKVEPWALAIDPSGNLWSSDGVGTRYIDGYYPEGEYFGRFGETGSGPGQFGATSRGIAVAPDGSIWVADTGNSRVEKWVPATPYLVETARVTQVKRTEATLNGRINPEGKATSYRFEYGTTPSFGISVPATPKSIGSGTEPVTVSQFLIGLKAETTYYYHLVATTEGGTTYGETRHFTTLPGPKTGSQVLIGGKTFTELGIKEATAKLSGSFRIETAGGFLPSFQCSEKGTGTLVSTGVAHESVTLTCVVIGAESNCYVRPFSFYVNGSFESPGYFATIITEQGAKGGCHVDEQLTLPSPKGSFQYGSEATYLNVTASATDMFGGWPVTMTGSSQWSLEAPYTGQQLAFDVH